MVGLAVYVAHRPTATLPIFLLVIGFGTARAFATPGDAVVARRHRRADPPPVAHRAPGPHVAGRARPRPGARRLPLRGRSLGAVRRGRRRSSRWRRSPSDSSRCASRPRRYAAEAGAPYPGRRGRACTRPSRGSGSCAASRSCSARSPSTCSRCSSAARSRCSPPSPRTASASVPSASGGCGRRPGSVRASSRSFLTVRPVSRRIGAHPAALGRALRRSPPSCSASPPASRSRSSPCSCCRAPTRSACSSARPSCRS